MSERPELDALEARVLRAGRARADGDAADERWKASVMAAVRARAQAAPAPLERVVRRGLLLAAAAAAAAALIVGARVAPDPGLGLGPVLIRDPQALFSIVLVLA